MARAGGAAVRVAPGAAPPTLARLAAESALPRREATLLAAWALGSGAAWVLAHGDDPLSAPLAARVAAALQARREGVPIAYITGEREFYGLPLQVSRDVLIPRSETELLVDLAREVVARADGADAENDGRLRIVDLGTGSGAVAVALAVNCPRAEVWAVDRSAAALAVACRNAARHGATVRFVASDWFAALGEERFDLVAANPPYVAAEDPHLQQGDLRFEPRTALCGGRDGLDELAAIIRGAPRHLTPEGWLLLEHGFDQGAAVRGMLAAQAWRDRSTRRDLAGLERVAAARAPLAAGPGRTGKR